MTPHTKTARFAPMARGAGADDGSRYPRNLSRGGRVKPPLLPVKLRPAFGSGGFFEATKFAPGGAGRAVTFTGAQRAGVTPPDGSHRAHSILSRAASRGRFPAAPGNLFPSAHVGQIGTADAGRNLPSATGVFRGGNTAPHASGALTECATSENAAGGNQ